MLRTILAVLKNFSIYLGSSVFAAAIPFMLMPVLTRVLSPSDYGLVAMFGLLIAVYGAIVGASVQGVVAVKYFELELAALAQYVGATMVIALATLLATLCLTLLLIDEIHALVSLPREWIYLAAIAAALKFIINVRLSLWRAMRNASSYGRLQITQSALDAGLTLVLVLLIGMNWAGRTFGQLFALSVIGLVSLIILRRDRLISWPSRLSSDASNALRFGVPLVPHVLGGLAVMAIGRLVVADVLGMAAVGQYMVGLQFGVLFTFIADAFGKAYSPWLYKLLQKPSDQDRLIVVGATYIIAALFICAAIVISLCAYLFFPVVVGKQFDAARAIVPVFVLSGAFTGIYYSVSGLFFLTSRTKYISVATVGSGLIGVFLCFVLVESFGLWGAALSQLIAQMCLFLIAWITSWRVYPLPWMRVSDSLSAVRGHLRNYSRMVSPD